jgi:type I restriction enzyme, S subunit
MSDREKYKRANAGDIAYNMMRMWQGAVGVAPVDGLISPAYIVAKPLPETDSGYYGYLFRIGAYMDEVNKFSRGIVSDRNRLYWEDFKQMPSPFPPPAEQAVIVQVPGSLRPAYPALHRGQAAVDLAAERAEAGHPPRRHPRPRQRPT